MILMRIEAVSVDEPLLLACAAARIRGVEEEKVALNGLNESLIDHYNGLMIWIQIQLIIIQMNSTRLVNPLL